MNISIKPVEIGFADQFHDCLNEVAKEQKFLVLLEAPPKEKMREFLQFNIENQVPQVFAFDDEQMIGWCDIRPNTHETTKHRAELGMGVVASYRGKGVGRKLLTTCLDQAKNVGIETVYLQVFSDNHEAIKLYEQFGFKQEGLIKNYRK